MIKSILTLVLSFFSFFCFGAYLKNLPTTITQPDGTTINCFATGDEFYNWLHDKEGYTIIQSPNGYYYYAVQVGDALTVSHYLVNSVDPSAVGLIKWTKISTNEYQRKRAVRTSLRSSYSDQPSLAPQTGTLNNLVIYIRFSDDLEFNTTRQFYDDKLNLTTDVSLKAYFKEVSYDKLIINSTHYPACPLTSDFSYQDSHPRKYYQPYNATQNRIGYTGEDDLRIREHTLLKNSINWLNSYSQVPATLNIDEDGDDNVDNVCFMVKGGSDGWNDLLWAHSWSLNYMDVFINGKRVDNYTFQPENQVDIRILSHEMFHALGSPDLYHYKNQGELTPVGGWDLMEYGFGHMSAYMKWKYTNKSWIRSIPEIKNSGTYTINPLTSATNNCFKIASQNSSSEYYVVEYRKKTGLFESNIPGSGLLVYRIDTCEYGNSEGPPDEVYIYRPNGTRWVDGDVSLANFSSTVGRTAINNATNPSGFLQNGTDGGLDISNISEAGNTISFSVTLPCLPPTTQATSFTPLTLDDNSMTVGWTRGNGNAVIVIAREENAVDAGPVSGSSYTANSFFGSGSQLGNGNFVVFNGIATSVNLTGLNPGTNYYFAIYEYNTVSNCYQVPALNGNAKTTGVRNSYCVSSGNMNFNTGITSVSFNDLYNVSEKPTSYTHYSELTTTVTQNSIQELTVKLNTDGNYEIHAIAWIDWDQDCDFSDTNEIYDLGSTIDVENGVSSLSPLAITIPSSALTGKTRMRISTKFKADPFSCEVDFDGEVEDYSINVEEPCTPPSTKASEFSSAAITDNSMIIGWTRGNGNLVLVVARADSDVDVDPESGSLYVANSVFGSGTQIGTGNYVVYNGYESAVNITALTAGSTYYFAIYEYSSASNCYLMSALIGNAKTTGEPPYCEAGSLATGGEYISNVEMGNMNQASERGIQGYQDYTSQVASIRLGENAFAKISITNPYSSDQLLIWIDWNKDGDFDDADENVYTSTSTVGSSHATSNFLPPIGTTVGPTRMRIRLHDVKNTPNYSPCGNSNWGEVEDYTINVAEACAPPSTQASAFSYSQLSDNSMLVSWTRGTGDAVLVVASAGIPVIESLVGGTIYTANELFGSGTEIGTGNYVVYNGIGSSVNLTGLIPGTTYYFAVYEYNAASNCYLSPALTGNATTTGIACTPCISYGSTNFATSITLVSFNDLYNVSEKPASYTDYSDLSTTVTKGSTYGLTVKLNTAGGYTVHAFAWMDWDHDCDFSDLNESYDLGSAYNVTNGLSSFSSLGINVPSTALTGKTIMRVSARYSSNPISCGTAFDGEVEDYSINVENKTVGVIEAVECQNSIKVYPNPVLNELIMEYDGTIGYEVMNAMGQVFLMGDLNKKTVVQTSNLMPGIYLIRFNTGSSLFYSKFIKR